MRRAERGFTLLEVLAAVAILGILYTTLVGVAMEGLRAEGTSKRRLEASLIADRQLAELDLQLDLGTSPQVGVNEAELGDFLVTSEVEPFDLEIPGLEDENGRLAPLLSDVTVDSTSPLRRIRITVSWLEADAEYKVVRTTFGVDPTSLDLQALLPEAPAQGTGNDEENAPQPAESES